jgi:hypothetical protein
MSDQDKAKGKSEITRRATFKLATAVAAFGAAMGMRANSAGAEGIHVSKGSLKESSGTGNATVTIKQGSAKDSSSKMKFKMEGSDKSRQEGSSYLKKGN